MKKREYERNEQWIINRHHQLHLPFHEEGNRMIGLEETDNGTKRRTREEIERIGNELTEKVRQELEDVWDKIWQEAFDLCPKKSWSLAHSIQVIEGALGMFAGGSNVKDVMFFDRSIIAGDEMIINPDTNKPTSEYASLVHDGHLMRDGKFWNGVPFLTDALAKYDDELTNAVNKAMQELGITGSED